MEEKEKKEREIECCYIINIIGYCQICFLPRQDVYCIVKQYYKVFFHSSCYTSESVSLESFSKWQPAKFVRSRWPGRNTVTYKP